jgi:hypothetical protein
MEVIGQVHTSAVLPPKGKSPSPHAHWIRRWVNPKDGLNAVAKRKKFHHCPCRESNPCRPIRSLVPILTQLPRKSLNFLPTDTGFIQDLVLADDD